MVGQIEYKEILMSKHNGPKVLFVDIENTPCLASVWGLWKEVTSYDMIEAEWYILCICAKWQHENKIMSFALPDYPLYKKSPDNDIEVLKAVHKLLDEADIVIGHNVVDFDIKKMNARFIKHGLPPTSPYKTVDTLLSARKNFAFTSNKLGDLGKYLGLGEKIDTGGFKLWQQCMKGDKTAWGKMVAYCKQDVALLEKIYNKLLPYMDVHPNLGAYFESDGKRCPNCGSESLTKNGFAFNNTGKYQRLVCNNCGAWSRDKKNLASKAKVNLCKSR